MKRIFFFVFLMVPMFCLEALAFSLALRPESKLWLEGDSTLHAYSSTAEKILFEIHANGEEEMGLVRVVNEGKVSLLKVAIPIAEMKSGNRRLDKNMYSALKASEFPEILFRMEGYKLVDGKTDSTFLAFEVQGTLTIAGVDKPVTIPVKLYATESKIQVQGEKKLLMTSFGIQPPVLMLGVLRTDDAVMIRFNIFLEKQKNKEVQSNESN